MDTITTMVTPTIRMITDAAKLMRLQSWFSPAFPIGAYSYSHALEWAVESGAVRDRATLVDWLDADLRHGAGRADGIFFAQTWRAVAAPSPSPAACGVALSREGRGQTVLMDSPCIASPGSSPLPLRERADAQRPGEGDGASPIAAADANDASLPQGALLATAELAAAMRATSELALESSQQGVAFLSAVRKAWPHPALDQHAALLREAGLTPVQPVAAGMACAVHGIPLELALPLYLHAGAANLINAAVRLIPLGQSDGQMAVAALERAVADTAIDVLQCGLADIGSAAFMIDIASMQHETQYTRLFRS